MRMQKNSLRKIVEILNNPEEDGGFWLPTIQRSFVWREDQIYSLFDSIMREYPISTLLVWKTKAKIRHRKFIENYHSKDRSKRDITPENDNKKYLVLDGQQRLQSLFIGLRGSYEGKELYFDILSGEVSAPDDIRFKFRFIDSKIAKFPWIKFKDIVKSKEGVVPTTDNLIAEAGVDLTAEDRKKIGDNVSIVHKVFLTDDGISYQELDSIDSTAYKEDDVVEVFIRANSGGTKLGKSDLLFSLLTSNWDVADEEIDDLLNDLNKHDFQFTRDFILKLFLTLLDQGATYQVSKFRKDGVREDIEKQWPKITEALRHVVDDIRGKTFIQCSKALPSYLVLIPLIYARYHFPDRWEETRDIDNYLLRTLISGAFSVRPDPLIDECVTKIKERGLFNTDDMFDAVRSQNKNLTLTEDRLWQIGYNSDTIYLLFNLWYREFNYTPAYKANLPQIDHIFPQSELEKIREYNPDTRGRRMKYRRDARDQLANCMLLTREENGAGGKSNTLPKVWFANKPDEYLDMHLIPHDKSLWEMERFEDFIEARKRLIKQKFSYLLSHQAACRVGMTIDPEKRKIEWAEIYPDIHDWAIIKDGLSYDDALGLVEQVAKPDGYIQVPGGPRESGRVYSVYQFYHG